MRIHLLFGIFASALVLSPSVGCKLNISEKVFTDLTFAGQKADRSYDGVVGQLIRKIEINNQFGDVEVRSSSVESNIRWEAACWATEKTTADAFLEQVKLQETKSGITQSWTVQVPKSFGDVTGIKSDITLTIPASVKVVVRNSHGNVTIKGMSGAIEATNEFGTVTANELTGDLKIRNSHGPITVNQAQNCDIVNSFGNTDLFNLSGETQINSSFGHVGVTDANAFVSIENNQGNVSVSGFQNGGKITASFGSLHVQNCDGGLELENNRGKIVVANAMGDQLKVKNSFGPTSIDSKASLIECDCKNGKIHARLTNPELKRVKLLTSFNDLTVVVHSDIKPNLRTEVDIGKLDSDFGPDETSVDFEAPLVELKNRNGNIYLKKEEADQS